MPETPQTCAILVLMRLDFLSPNVFMGYKDPALTRQVLQPDGWLDTGDLAWLDDQGYAHLCGRSKDLIKRNGHSVDPQAIEEVLQIGRAHV